MQSPPVGELAWTWEHDALLANTADRHEADDELARGLNPQNLYRRLFFLDGM